MPALITDNDPDHISQQAYRNFIDTCRSPYTRYMYNKSLDYFMSYLKLPQGAYNKLLETDPKIAQANVIDYVTYMSKSGHMASGSVAVYLAAIRKFYVMNDVQLNWDRIHSYQGENEKMTEDRPYTHSEVQHRVSHTSTRNKAIILLMFSAGLRVGGIVTLRIKDLEPIDKYNLYKVTVYAQSKKSRYFSFCSPECRSSIDNYLSLRRRWGDKLHEDEPLFRQEFNTSMSPSSYDDGNTRRQIKPLRVEAIKWGISNLLRNIGVKPVLPRTEDNQHHRSNIMTCHGLRKAFETNAYKAGMDHIYIRRLMGQKSGLEDSYLKLSEEELLEGDSKHVGYIGIIDQLTIDDTHRLKREVQTLRIDKSKMEQVLERINKLEDKILNQ